MVLQGSLPKPPTGRLLWVNIFIPGSSSGPDRLQSQGGDSMSTFQMREPGDKGGLTVGHRLSKQSLGSLFTGCVPLGSYLATLCLLFLECKTRKDCIRTYLQLCSGLGGC